MIIVVSGMKIKNFEKVLLTGAINLICSFLNFPYSSRWIYDNIMEKWDTIKRRPHRLVDMFTGYHATKAVIHSAFTQAGIDDK